VSTDEVGQVADGAGWAAAVLRPGY